MDLQAKFKELKASAAFKAWDKKGKAHLAHIVVGDDLESLHFGFFDSSDDLISTFVLEKEGAKQLQDSEALKEKGAAIKELDLAKVKVDFQKALGLFDAIVKEKAGRERIIKRIFILQSLDHQVWNISAVTATFNTVNVKIDALSGTILSQEAFSLKDAIRLEK